MVELHFLLLFSALASYERFNKIDDCSRSEIKGMKDFTFHSESQRKTHVQSSSASLSSLHLPSSVSSAA